MENIRFSAKNEHFVSLQWVCSAVGESVSRVYVNYVYVSGSYILATDGYRLHKYAPRKDNMPLEPGFYEILKNNTRVIVLKKVEFYIQIPVYEKAWTLDSETCKPVDWTYTGHDSANLYTFAAAVSRVMDEKKGFNLPYVEQALKVELTKLTVDKYACALEDNSGVHYAKIMGMRLV